MIRIENLGISYGKRVLLHDGNAEFLNGSLTALIGRNGVGKSTLLRAMAGLNNDYSGKIEVDGNDIRGMGAGERARFIAFVNTRSPRIANLNCRDVVSLGRAPYTDWIGRLGQKDREAVDKALEMTGMISFANKSMDKMSDGECQRIMIARALAQDTQAILLDEPTSFLDLPNRFELITLLKQLASRENKTIVFSTHELVTALEFCDNIALIDHEKLVTGSVEEICSSKKLEDIFSTKKGQSKIRIVYERNE